MFSSLLNIPGNIPALAADLSARIITTGIRAMLIRPGNIMAIIMKITDNHETILNRYDQFLFRTSDARQNGTMGLLHIRLRFHFVCS